MKSVLSVLLLNVCNPACLFGQFGYLHGILGAIHFKEGYSGRLTQIIKHTPHLYILGLGVEPEFWVDFMNMIRTIYRTQPHLVGLNSLNTAA